MLHGANPDEAVSARGPIAIRYVPLFRFSNEHDFYRAIFGRFYEKIRAGKALYKKNNFQKMKPSFLS